jgi:hypothetical protein
VLKIGIISNPRSHRNRRHMAGLRELIVGEAEVLHEEIDHMAGLAEILADFSRREVGRIVVNGGDGTVQAVMTALLNNGGADEPPTLAVLASGRTNLIAHNIGLAGSPRDGLARLFARRRHGDPLEGVSRPVLSLDLGGGGAVIHGMFLGSAAFYRGTMIGRTSFHPLGAVGPAVVGLSLGLVLARALLGRPGGILQGDAMTVIHDDDREAARSRDYFLILATTLDHLILGLTPFWDDGGGTGPLRLTTVTYPPPRLARALLPLARGRPRPWMADSGYRSRRLARVTLVSACPIVFDGQIFTPDPAVPVTIGGGRSLRFLRC